MTCRTKVWWRVALACQMTRRSNNTRMCVAGKRLGAGGISVVAIALKLVRFTSFFFYIGSKVFFTLSTCLCCCADMCNIAECIIILNWSRLCVFLFVTCRGKYFAVRSLYSDWSHWPRVSDTQMTHWRDALFVDFRSVSSAFLATRYVHCNCLVMYRLQLVYQYNYWFVLKKWCHLLSEKQPLSCCVAYFCWRRLYPANQGTV